MSNGSLGILLIVGLVIALLVLSPLAIIWALNTLFLLAIPYNLWTWLAVVVLLVLLGGSRAKVRNSD